MKTHQKSLHKCYPMSAYKTNPMQMMKKFLNRMLIVFFCLVSPISSRLKPKCIKNTRAVQIIIHRLLTVSVSVVSICCMLLFQSKTATFTSTNAIRFFYRCYEYFPVADLSGLCSFKNGMYGFFYEIVIYNDA